jgi:hypothetical protein
VQLDVESPEAQKEARDISPLQPIYMRKGLQAEGYLRAFHAGAADQE